MTEFLLLTAPREVRQCIAGVPLPGAFQQCGSALQESHSPVPQGREALRCRSSSAYYPQAVTRCIAGYPRPTVPKQCGWT